MSDHPDDFNCFGNIHPMTAKCANCNVRRACSQDTYCETEADYHPDEDEEMEAREDG